MASSQISCQRGKSWQQCADKLEQSTMDTWRRSTRLWQNSKYRWHQTTMEAWHRSANTLSRSKTRCQQSTADALNRSANKWHQSTECLHRLSLSREGKRGGMSEEEVPTPDESEPSVRSPPLAQRHEDPKTSDSPDPCLPTAESFVPSTARTIQSPREHDSAEEQIRDILNLTDQVMYQANQTKQLKISKKNLLGEIELDWINATILEASSAARDLAKLVEPYRLDILKRKGRMRSTHRKSWNLVDYNSACERFLSLALHQEKLGKVCKHLQDVSDLNQHSFSEFNLEAFAELPARTVEPSPSVIELPSEPVGTTPQSDTTLVELPGDSQITKFQSLQPIPIIIVTQAPDNPLYEGMEGSDAEIFSHENKETNGILHWEQTRDDIRLQQSESLSNIVAMMESTRND